VEGIPPFGHMYAGKPSYQCWYDKTPLFNHFHLQATNWNKTEHEVKQACKVRLITGWHWVEEHNQAGMQLFSVTVRINTPASPSPSSSRCTCKKERN
jgi:hypothetical protein